MARNPLPGIVNFTKRSSGTVVSGHSNKNYSSKKNWQSGMSLGFQLRFMVQTIIAGNSGADGQRGAAYVFTADDKLKWSQQTKLVAGDGLIKEYFAPSVATNGSEVLVSAPRKAITGPSSGAVYYSGITAP